MASLAAAFTLTLAAVSAVPASATPATPGPAAVDREPPAKWDGRVADLADFVERKRDQIDAFLDKIAGVERACAA